jgi:hypothetical protein
MAPQPSDEYCTWAVEHFSEIISRVESAGFTTPEDLLKDVLLFRQRLSELLPAQVTAASFHAER